MRHYTFLIESQNDSSIRYICKTAIEEALKCNIIITAKNILSRAYQQCLMKLSLTKPTTDDIKCINILEQCYLEMNRHGTEWKPVLLKFLKLLQNQLLYNN